MRSQAPHPYLITRLQMLVTQQMSSVILFSSDGVLVLLASQKLHEAWNDMKRQPKKSMQHDYA